jgi:DNA-binding response OmpR family regulator
MGGVELITRIRALAHRQGVPIVMVTGTEECAVLADALAAGADEVLYKPTDVAILVDTVSKCVEGVGGGAHRWGRSDERRPGAAPMSPPDLSLPETDARRCASCRSPQVLPIGRVIAIAGMIKQKHWCEGCGTVFLFVRKPIV